MKLSENIACHFPRARCGKGRIHTIGRPGEVFGSRSQEGRHTRVNPVADGPVVPIVGIDIERQVNEAIGKRARKAKRHGFVLAPVAGGDDLPPIRQDVFADTAIENKLVKRRLYKRGCCIDFV